MSDDWNEMLSDRLRELGNIGCGHALAALSQMTSAAFTVRAPDIEFVDYNSIPRLVAAAEDEMVGVMLEISGDLKGVFLLLLKPDIAERLLEGMNVARAEGGERFALRAVSALLELGNIMCNSYMTAVYKLTGLRTSFSIPSLAADMLGAILNAPVARFAKDETRVMYIQNVFSLEGRDWVGSTLLMPELESANRLGERLGTLL